jgi:S-adenosylmethionine-diacylglycerol 3-amino-3-carboxypropyl transferase
LVAKEYFSDLNYTLANEDTRIEFDLLPMNADQVFCIAGSGSRVLPLIAKNPRRIEVVDMSVSQLYLTELRYQATKVMSYEEWLFFFGYRGALQSGGSDAGDDRAALFDRVVLSSEARQYWQERREGWTTRGFIFLGRWESHFQKLGKIFREYLRCDFTPIFEAQNLPEQIELWKKHWPAMRFTAFMRVAASEYVFNKYLYKGHFAGNEGGRTEQKPPYQFLEEAFHRIFHTQLVRKGYFLQVLFLGKIRFEEGLPLEAHQSVFDAVKAARTELTYRVGNLLEILPEKAWDFVSLSDTVSYLSAPDANALLKIQNAATRPGSTMVIRSFLRAPTAIDLQGWEELKDVEEQAWKRDVSAVYRFHIYRKK